MLGTGGTFTGLRSHASGTHWRSTGDLPLVGRDEAWIFRSGGTVEVNELFLALIQPLESLETDVPEPIVIQLEELLSRRKIGILLVEQIEENVGGGARTLVFGFLRDGLVVFTEQKRETGLDVDGCVHGRQKVGILGMGKEHTHVLVITFIGGTVFWETNTVIAGVVLRRQEPHLDGGCVVGWNSDRDVVSIAIDETDTQHAKTFDCSDTVRGLDRSEVAVCQLTTEVLLETGACSRASSVEQNGKDICWRSIGVTSGA